MWTRGIFVTPLGRLVGIDPKAYPISRFTDVPVTADYAPYVEWAAGTGIVNGTGENTFSPDATVTREQVVVFMQRYANSLTYTLPITREAESFVDASQIASDGKDAIRILQQAGILNGKDIRQFGPKDTATRAEAATVLRRFVTIVIDPADAGDWAQNYAGHWLYYLDGKPVTDWKQIESNWYYFDTAGMM